MPGVRWVTYCWGEYQQYLPFWLYSVRRAYPDHDVVAGVEGKLEPEIAAAVGDVIKTVPARGGCDIIEEANIAPKGVPNNRLHAVRLFLPRGWFGDGEACLSSVDVLVIRGLDDVIEQHRALMKLLGRPYSNIPMTGEIPVEGPWYNTTYHYFAVKPYFEKVVPIRREMIGERRLRDWCQPETYTWTYGYEGWLLYRMLARAFGPPPDCEGAPPHIPTNGIHCRRFRSRQDWPRWTVAGGLIQQAHALLVSQLGNRIRLRSSPKFKKLWRAAVQDLTGAINAHSK